MKKKYIIGGAIIAVVAGYLLYLTLDSSLSYYVTVSELVDKGPEVYDTDIRVAGKVADSPVEWVPDEIELSFTITEGGQMLPVVYNGAKPDGFTAGADIVVEGKYSPDNIFRASSIVLKCPSKYELEE